MSSLLNLFWRCSLLAIPLCVTEALAAGAFAARPDALAPTVTAADMLEAKDGAAHSWQGLPAEASMEDAAAGDELLPGATEGLANSSSSSSAWVLEEFSATSQISPVAEFLLGEATDESEGLGEQVDRIEVAPGPPPTLHKPRGIL
jgi:hypothetical protein